LGVSGPSYLYTNITGLDKIHNPQKSNIAKEKGLEERLGQLLNQTF